MTASIRRPAVFIIFSIFVLLVFAAGAHRLAINADTRVFFSDHNENRQALDAFEARYASSTNLLIVLHAREGDVFTPARLQTIVDLNEEAWGLPYSTRVDSVTGATHISSNAEGIVLEDMIPAALTGDPAVARERVMNDELLVGRLISRDAKSAAINVTVQYPMNSSKVTGEILDAAKAMVAASDAEASGLEVWYGGRVASSFAFSKASKTDLATLIPLCFVVLLTLLIVLLRSFAVAGALFLTSALAAVASLGLAGWLGWQITAATAHTPTVIIALGVASLSHLVLSARRFAREGMDNESALRAAIAADLKPIALTLCTTCIGFLTLNAADAPPFREFGSLVAAGSLFCLFFGVAFLPPLLRYCNLAGRGTQPFIMRGIAVAADAAVKKRKALVIGAPVVAVLSVFGIALIEINDTFPDYFTERFEFRRHADLIEQHLTGLEVIEFDVGASRDDAIFDAAYVREVEKFEAWLSAQPKVEHVSSILEIYRRLNQHLTDGRPESHAVPADRELLAQYILLYEMSLPLGRELTNAITVDKSRSRVTAIMRNASTRDVRSLRERAEVWLNEESEAGIDGAGTGLAVMFAYLSSLNVQSMIGGTALALILISGILMLAFRSIRYGLISLIPNLLPGAMAFGLWGYLVGEVGVAVSVVGAMTLGIIVDDTVHLLWRYREARKNSAEPEAAVREMFAKVGEPMLVSTIVLVAGFLVLFSSGFHITSSTGVLTAATLGIALLMDWFFLAPLLILVDNALLRRAGSLTAPPERDLVLVADNFGDVRDEDMEKIRA